MEPVNFKGATIRHQPADWDEGKYGPCQGLPVMYDDGVFHSLWKPSFYDRIRLLFGGVLNLAIVANGQPPVNLKVMRMRK